MNMISNGELSDPLCDGVSRGLTSVRLGKKDFVSVPGIPGHPIKFRLTNSVINNKGSAILYRQFNFLNNAIFLFNVTFTLIG